jgi:hypothetical protein
MRAVLQPERKEAPLSAIDLSPLVPPWPELEPADEMSPEKISACIDRLEQESRDAAGWGTDRAAVLLILGVGNWLMLSDPPPSEDAVSRLNDLLGQYEGPVGTESRRFG